MIATTLRVFFELFKDFNDAKLFPFEVYCDLYIDRNTRCPSILPATSYPNNYGGACPPSTFANYGMSGYVCYVGNEEGSTGIGRSANVYYRFSLPEGTYTYELVFKYLVYGSDGYDGGDTALAEVSFFNEPVWRRSISKCTVDYGTVRIISTINWPGGETELRFRLSITGVFGGFMDHRNFTIDDVALKIMQPKQLPFIQSPSMVVLSI